MSATPPLHETPFFSVDSTWLHMDAPCNRVTIVGLGLYDEPMKFARLRAVVQDRLLRFDRFRQRVRETRWPLGLPTWEPDPQFDLDAHLWRAKLPAPGDWGALQGLVEKLMVVPLPADRPLWRMILVEHFGAGSAMILCLSHALADGLAILHVFDTLTGTTAKNSLARLAPKAEPPQVELGPASRIALALDEAKDYVVGQGDVLKQTLAVAQDPLGSLLRGADIGLALGKVLLIPPDHPTALKGRCGPAKRAVVCDPIPLAQAKSVGKAFGAKVNDVVLSAVTGALHNYLLARGEAVRGQNIRALVPVYLHPWQDATDLRNGFGLVFLSLPVGIADPVRRLRVLKARMDKIKSSPEAIVTYGIMQGMGHTPPAVERLIAGAFGAKGTAVITNVMGPAEVRYLAGVPTSRMLFWVPQPAGLGLGVSMISYNGELNVCLATDAELVPDPEVIVAEFQKEFRQLVRLSAHVPSKTRAPAKRKSRPAAPRRNPTKARARQPA
jgi:diacylglycerol O-acyltransferase